MSYGEVLIEVVRQWHTAWHQAVEGQKQGGESERKETRKKGESMRALFLMQSLSAYKTIIVS